MSDVTVTIAAKNALLKTGLNEGKAYVREFAKDVGNMMAGAFAGGAILEEIKKMADRAKNILADAVKVGSTTEDVQLLGNAAERTGSNLESLVGTLTKLTKAAQLAANEGDAKLLESFKNLGVSVDDLKEKSSAELFYQIADAIKEGKDQGNQMVDVMAIMGKSAGDLLPTLKLGADGIKDLGREGLVQTREELENLKEVDEVFKRFEVGAERFFGWIVKIMETVGAVAAFATLAIGDVFNALTGHGNADPDATTEAFTDELADIWGRKKTEKSTGAAQKGAEQPDEDTAAELKKKGDTRRDTEEKLAQIKEDAARKQLSLADQIKELTAQKTTLDEQWAASAKLTEEKLKDLGQERIKNAQEIVNVEKQITTERERQAKAEQDAMEKQGAKNWKTYFWDPIKNILKQADETAKNKLTATETQIAHLEAMLRGGAVDDLRSAGLGYFHADYSHAGERNTLAEQLSVLKQSLEQQKRTNDLLGVGQGAGGQSGNASPALQPAAYGGNFNTPGTNAGPAASRVALLARRFF